MGRPKSSKAASQLQAVSKALAGEQHVLAWVKELSCQIALLQNQRVAAERDLAAIQEILNADPDLTAVARQLMQKALAAKGKGGHELGIPNPKYVASERKRNLLLRILQDHSVQNPEASTMTYTAIKSVLKSRYGIETASAGLFFRNELKEWETRGGNKNKSVVLNFGQIQGRKS